MTDGLKIEGHLDAIRNLFQHPVSDHERKVILSRYFEPNRVSINARSKINLRLRSDGIVWKIPVRWSKSANIRRSAYTSNKQILPLEIIPTFFEKAYLSFGSALFWNDLTNERPNLFFVSEERSTDVPRDFSVDQFSLRDAFMKKPREPVNLGNYKGSKFVLLQRPNYDYISVSEKTIDLQDRKISIRLTDLERTLVDCAINPDRAGGYAHVALAFEQAKDRLSVDRLIAIYQRYGPAYPYWQVIGWYLSNFHSKSAGADWKSKFGAARFDMYLARPYKADWKLDKEWRVYHPEGADL